MTHFGNAENKIGCRGIGWAYLDLIKHLELRTSAYYIKEK